MKPFPNSVTETQLAKMAPQVLQRVLSPPIESSPSRIASMAISSAILEGYTRHCVIDCDYPAIVPDIRPQARVLGTYVQGLTSTDQFRLDIFEGDEYVRKPIKCRLIEGPHAGHEVTAETYVWKAGLHGLLEAEWNFEDFCRSKISRWIDDKEYAGKFLVTCVGVSAILEALTEFLYTQ